MLQDLKHYLNAIKAKQSALNARKLLVGGREPHLCSRPFGLELRPFKPRACRDPPPLAEYLTTGQTRDSIHIA